MGKKKADNMSTDEMLEELVKAHREKIEKILKEQDAAEFKEGPKAEDTLKSILSLFLDPEVRGHFVKAGIEILSGIEQLLKSAPMPDDMKQNVEKACDITDKVVNNIVKEVCPDKKPKGKKTMKKIDVE